MFWHISIWIIYPGKTRICNTCVCILGISIWRRKEDICTFTDTLIIIIIVETRFLELAMSLLDFSHHIPLGTFSILLLFIKQARWMYFNPHSWRQEEWRNTISILSKQGFMLKRKRSYALVWQSPLNYRQCTVNVTLRRYKKKTIADILKTVSWSDNVQSLLYQFIDKSHIETYTKDQQPLFKIRQDKSRYVVAIGEVRITPVT